MNVADSQFGEASSFSPEYIATLLQIKDAHHESAQPDISEESPRNPADDQSRGTFSFSPEDIASLLEIKEAHRESAQPNFYEESPRSLAELTSALYLSQERPGMLAKVPSHKLLVADDRNGVLAGTIEPDSNVEQFLYVNEKKCVGCTWCAHVAKSTFVMEENEIDIVGRVYQQHGDPTDVIDEAVACCPTQCIHHVSFNELKARERHGGDLEDIEDLGGHAEHMAGASKNIFSLSLVSEQASVDVNP
jgi:ferredoxin